MTTPERPEESDSLIQIDPLEALLSQPMDSIADDGFTARVVAALPPRRHDLLRPAILLSASAVGFALADRWLPWGNLPSVDWYSLSPQLPQEIGPWLMVFTVMASLTWAVANALNNEGDLI
jgi:hypothetical protein